MLCKKDVLRNFTKFTGKHLCQSHFIKKGTLAQVFSCEFCKISRNTFLHRVPLVAASESSYYLPPPLLPYQRLIWDYRKAGTSNIRKNLDFINWEKLFSHFSHKDSNAQVTVFNEIILNIFRNYVLNKYNTFDDKDPVWMNENIKSKIKPKNLL